MKNKIKLIIPIIFLIGAIIGFGYSLYKIITWQVENSNTEKNIQVIMDMTKIEVQEDNTIEVDFTNLKKNNSDLVGWITINNTNINYPVVQYKDNDFYLNHSFDKKYNGAGWIFMDHRNNSINLDGNTIIYGHNRKDGSMFGSLKKALNKDWLNDPENRLIKFNTLDTNYLFEIFSLYRVSGTDDYVSTSLTNDLIKTFKKRSAYKLNVDVTKDDKILTLQTCSGSSNKLVVHAKLVSISEKESEN